MHLTESGHSPISHVPHKPNRSGAWKSVVPEAAFRQAYAEISRWPDYRPTPLLQLKALSSRLGLGEILYKDESLRFEVGSFKALGAPYAASQVLCEALNSRAIDTTAMAVAHGKMKQACASLTLSSATDGNHGRALAWGAQRFGARCRIFIHAEVSQYREQAMADLGAEVVRIDGDYDESVRIARIESEQNGWFVVSDTSWDGYTKPPSDIMAGYGVMVDEITGSLSQPPTHVFAQGGVGGLAGAVFARLVQHYGEHAPRMIVVEPEHAACLQTSARKGEITTIPIISETVMAGLSCGEPSPIGWTILADLATDFLSVSDAGIAPAMQLLGNPLEADPAAVAGESAVAGLVALIEACNHPDLKKSLALDDQSRVLLLGTEGATDPVIYQQMMASK